MADVKYEITSGFYDSIDQDRRYSADQMNMPYKRVISEGVFATPQGTPSTDFQVFVLSGQSVKVSAGNALLGEKWLELEADQNVTISGNPSANPRIDSIILRTDRNTGERKATIIYREGAASSNPSAPALDTSSNVYELRLANIRLEAGASAVTQSMITDMRGSAECPWITSLVYQVDTSTLFAQWQDAYNRAYSEHEEQWTEFFEQLTQELTLQTSVVTQSGTVNLTSAKSSVLITDFGINDYKRETCELMLFINGLYAVEGDKWTLSYDPSAPQAATINFDTQMSAGQSLYLVVMKSIITANASSIVEEVSDLETRMSAAENRITGVASDIDTVEQDLAGAESDISALGTRMSAAEGRLTAVETTQTSSVRFTIGTYTIDIPLYKRNGVVEFGGAPAPDSAISSLTSGTTIGTLPEGFRPKHMLYGPINSRNNGVWASATYYNITMQIATNGAVKLFGNTTALQSSKYINFAAAFIAEE